MSLQDELGIHDIEILEHEALLNIVFTGSILTKEGDRVLKEYGLTDAQFNVLMLLKYQTEDGAINQTKLGKMLLVNRSNITGLIDRLEQNEYVQRFPDAHDRRINLVKITKTGKNVLSKAEDAYYERIKEIMSDLSVSDCRKLCRSLEKIRAKIRS